MDATHAECRNCHHSLNEDDKFCSKCGQNTDTHKINLHYVIHELIHGILHLDGGIIHTTKALFTKPGIMIREYLEGKRKNHFSPIIFIVILSTILVLIKHYLYNDHIINAAKLNTNNQSEIGKRILQIAVPALEWIFSHLTLLYLIQIPILAIGFYFIFKKMTKYNYLEWLLILSFCTIQIMIISIVFYFVNKALPGTMILSNILVIGVFIWTIIQLLSKFEIGKVIFNLVLSLTINFLIISIILTGIVTYYYKSNPNLFN
ncbi:DUF3667 domain-containing protein [Chryseobacterium formosus]|uniref:DUF3667 domain-containing protein n=1 Tax=Chryseobacterium formosus TaxID=1537363 RepID=A0ABT3XS35_9FLAO|nr:DUF3667 domain-containing protein [Chryseobacterium formosus]MCX8524158.1 DUF3667 domain-containing protein [Chryseobacterium formosus]